MESKLITNNLFIDTSEFRHRQFDLESTALAEILDLTKSGDATLLTTQITVDECKRRIREGIEHAGEEHKKIDASKAWAFKRIPEFKLLLNPVNIRQLADRLITGFEDYLKTARVQFIDIKQASLDEVIDQYTAKAPPFGLGKKGFGSCQEL